MSEATVPATGKEPAAARRQMLIAKAHRARDLTEEIMPWAGLSEKDIEELQNLSAEGGADGFVIKVLFEEPSCGLSLTYAWFKANYLLPRHSHNADCTYYIISGEAHLGTEILRAGDVFFVPSNAFYRYQAGAEGVEVLEFRTATRFEFRVSGLSKRYMERASRIVAENRGKWQQQEVPLAARRFSDPLL